MSSFTVNDIAVETTYPVRYLRRYNLEVSAYRVTEDQLLVITKDNKRHTLKYSDGEYVLKVEAMESVPEEKQKTDWEAYYKEKAKMESETVTVASILETFKNGYKDNEKVQETLSELEKGRVDNIYFDGNKLTFHMLMRSNQEYTIVYRVSKQGVPEISIAPVECWSYWNSLIQYRVED